MSCADDTVGTVDNIMRPWLSRRAHVGLSGTVVLIAIFGRDAYVPRALYPMTLPHVLATGLVAPLVLAVEAPG